MKYYTMQDAIRLSSVSKNTIIRWEQKGRVKIKRDPMFNYRLFTIEDIEKIKELKGV